MDSPFDEVSFPPDLAYKTVSGPHFGNQILTTGPGYEIRWQRWQNEVHDFSVYYDVRSPSSLGTMLAFFTAREGATRGFRLHDPADFSSSADGVTAPLPTDQPMSATATGTIWQLNKRYVDGYTDDYGNVIINSSYKDRAIRKPVAGSVRVAVGGTEVLTGFTVDATTGLVTFTSAPGGLVTAGYLFEVPVRFGNDVDKILQAQSEDFGRGSSSGIPMIEIKDGPVPSAVEETPIELPINHNPITVIPPSEFPPEEGGSNMDPPGGQDPIIIVPVNPIGGGGGPSPPPSAPCSCPEDLASSYTIALKATYYVCTLGGILVMHDCGVDIMVTVTGSCPLWGDPGSPNYTFMSGPCMGVQAAITLHLQTDSGPCRWVVRFEVSEQTLGNSNKEVGLDPTGTYIGEEMPACTSDTPTTGGYVITDITVS